jgi:Zn-dependent peptidase ImmA (M78 family)
MNAPPADLDRAAIRARADAVRSRYPADLPCDELLYRICDDEGIELFKAVMGDLAGVLRPEGDRWRIYLNRGDSPTRRRFTLAHLLGHYFLHASPGRTFTEGPFVSASSSHPAPARSFGDQARRRET